MTKAEEKRHEAVKTTNRIQREYIKSLEKRIENLTDQLGAATDQLGAANHRALEYQEIAMDYREEALKMAQLAREQREFYEKARRADGLGTADRIEATPATASEKDPKRRRWFTRRRRIR